MSVLDIGELIGILLFVIPLLVTGFGLHRISLRSGHSRGWLFAAYLPPLAYCVSVLAYVALPDGEEILLGFGMIAGYLLSSVITVVLGTKRWPRDDVSAEVFR